MEKFYVKHIFRTVRKAPVQPFLILLIFTLSFLLMNVGLTAGVSIDREEGERAAQSFGTSNVRISTTSVSASRFLFAEDAEAVPGVETVTSSFTMPFLKDGSLVSGVAVPFADVGNIFNLNFTESREIRRGELDRVAFVTSSFAAEQGLEMGSVFTAQVFGKQVSYEIVGISDKPFLGSYDVLVDITGAVSILLGDPAVSAILGSSFSPGGTLYVRFEDGADSAETLRLLKAAFPSDNVTPTVGVGKSTIVIALRAISFFLVLVTAVAAFTVAFCCVSCMAKERAENAALFSLCGVTERKMLLLQIAEIGIYALGGIAFGTALSGILGRLTFSIIGFRFITYELRPLAWVISVLTVLTVAVITPIFFRVKSRGRAVSFRIPRPVRFLLPAILLLSIAGGYLLPFKLLFADTIVFLLALFLCIGIYFPRLFRFTAKKISVHTKDVSRTTGLKNASRVSALANTARLIAILITVIGASFSAVCASDNFVTFIPTLLDADFTISGGTSRVAESLKNVPEIGELYGSAYIEGVMLDGSADKDGININAWAFSSPEVLREKNVTFEIPESGEVITSYAYACKFGLREGDTLTLSLGSVTKEVRISKVLDSRIFFLFFNVEDFGVAYDSYLIKGAPGVAYADLYAAVTSALSTETVSILPTYAPIEHFIGNNRIYAYFGKIIAVMLLIFALIGVADNLAESYRSRRPDFALLRIAGMSRRNLRKMLAAEIVYTMLSVIVVGIPILAISFVMIRQGLLAFGVDYYLLTFRA